MLGNADIEKRARFDIIRYANCWEDADILCEALRPARGKRILSIASGGDNVFALLAEGAEVVAADISAAQLACVELKCAAFRKLDYEGLLRFIGVCPAQNRTATFADLKGDLSNSASRFWTDRAEIIKYGIIHAGKFERYFKLFRKCVLPLVHSRNTVELLLREKSEEARRCFYENVWNNRRWKLMFRIFFSRFMMGRLGRDPEFFRYVEGTISDNILRRAEYALTILPTHDNPFLDYILSGNFRRALPRYLKRERFEAVRAGLDGLKLHHGTVQEAAGKYCGIGFDGFNFSDIFEYMDAASAREIYEVLVKTAKRGARLAYWNMLVPRRCPKELIGRISPLEKLSRKLFERDRAFFYSAFWIDEVIS